MVVRNIINNTAANIADGQYSRKEPNNSRKELLVKAEGIGVYKSGRWLIRNISLEVTKQEIIALIGPNGSGKSTTIKAVLGILKIDEGQISSSPGLTVGYVPQQLKIDETLPLTVRRLMTLTSRQSPRDISDALDMVGIRHLIDEQATQLSGGEFQRVMIARALIRRPDLLVLDEPVQGVDFAGEIALYELVRKIRDLYGCGIILISHDLHMVMAETDKVICLNGHVCCSGTPQLVAENPEYRRLFGPRAADALAIYRHDHDHTHGVDGSVVHDHADDPGDLKDS